MPSESLLVVLLGGFLLAHLLVYVFLVKMFTELKARLDHLERVGFLVTSQEPVSKVGETGNPTPIRRISRRELRQRIETRAAMKVGDES